MSRHIPNAGVDVFVHDPVPEPAQAAGAVSGRACPGPAAVAAERDVILVIPGGCDAVSAAIGGADGLLASACPGTVALVSSTISPVQAREPAQRCPEKGVAFVVAPACRDGTGAIGGHPVWPVGGSDADAARARSPMAPCGAESLHPGVFGAGRAGKATNDMPKRAALAADHEALAVAGKHGSPRKRLIGARLRSSGTNWPLKNWNDMNKIPRTHKDIPMVREAGSRARLAPPVAAPLRGQVRPLTRVAAMAEEFIR